MEPDVIKMQYEYVKDKLTETINMFSSEPIQSSYRKYLAEYRGMNLDVIDGQKIFYIESKEEVFDKIDPVDMDYLGFAWNGDNIFRERFIIPIFNHEGRAVAISGYDADSEIKYLYANTMFFDKRYNFFGSEDINECYKTNSVFIVEGLFDRMRLKQIGRNNSLSLMGTGMYPFHRKVLERFDKVILIPDNDKSGLEALSYWKNLDTKIAIMMVKDKELKDIDNYLKIEGNAKIFNDKANDILDFMNTPFYSQNIIYLN